MVRKINTVIQHKITTRRWSYLHFTDFQGRYKKLRL